jgi:outer membrane protein assembly factor BamB
VNVIQRIDLSTHESAVIGHLPYPLDGAAAVNLGGFIYLAGGQSPSVTPSATGVGTTQLDGWATAPAPASAGRPVGTIWAFDPGTSTVVRAGELQVPVSHAGVAVQGDSAWLVGGESGDSVVGTVQWLRPNSTFGEAGAPGAGSPYFGNQLLIADRGNDRLLLMDPSMKVAWSYPSASSPPDTLGFYFPDDAFFADHGRFIISNQEENETIVEIAYPSGRIIWSYGHPKVPGTAPGYLHEPDDAYVLRNGQISVADAQNCRVLVLNSGGTVASQIGTDGQCVHNPPASMGSPNGDTPLWNGDLLVSEINGSWISEYAPSGGLVWTVHLPIAYPSDPQQIDATAASNTDLYLTADYTRPGEVLQFNREGQVLSTYQVGSGPGMLDHPSLAELLPNGIYLINDDYNNRMVAIDPTNGALVWQYGVTGHAGTGAGELNTPDGFDLLGAGGTTPTHPQTG